MCFILYSPFGPFLVPSFGPSFHCPHRHVSLFDSVALSLSPSLRQSSPNTRRLCFLSSTGNPHRRRECSSTCIITPFTTTTIRQSLPRASCCPVTPFQSLPFSSVQFLQNSLSALPCLETASRPNDIYETYHSRPNLILTKTAHRKIKY